MSRASRATRAAAKATRFNDGAEPSSLVAAGRRPSERAASLFRGSVVSLFGGFVSSLFRCFVNSLVRDSVRLNARAYGTAPAARNEGRERIAWLLLHAAPLRSPSSSASRYSYFK